MTWPLIRDIIAVYRTEIVCQKCEYQVFSLFLSIPAIVICYINNTLRELIFLLSLPH